MTPPLIHTSAVTAQLLVTHKQCDDVQLPQCDCLSMLLDWVAVDDPVAVGTKVAIAAGVICPNR